MHMLWFQDSVFTAEILPNKCSYLWLNGSVRLGAVRSLNVPLWDASRTINLANLAKKWHGWFYGLFRCSKNWHKLITQTCRKAVSVPRYKQRIKKCLENIKMCLLIWWFVYVSLWNDRKYLTSILIKNLRLFSGKNIIMLWKKHIGMKRF